MTNDPTRQGRRTLDGYLTCSSSKLSRHILHLDGFSAPPPCVLSSESSLGRATLVRCRMDPTVHRLLRQGVDPRFQQTSHRRHHLPPADPLQRRLRLPDRRRSPAQDLSADRTPSQRYLHGRSGQRRACSKDQLLQVQQGPVVFLVLLPALGLHHLMRVCVYRATRGRATIPS